MSSRPFHALSGLEIKQIILKEIENQMNADCRFRINICYPLVSWRWKLAVNAHPMEPPNFETSAGATVKAPEADLAEAAKLPAEKIDLQGERVVAAPQDGETADSARRDAGLPVPAPRHAPGPVEGTRIAVDAPEIPVATAKEDAQPEPPRARPSTSRVAAKVAELRTRANPKGAVATPAKKE